MLVEAVSQLAKRNIRNRQIHSACKLRVENIYKGEKKAFPTHIERTGYPMGLFMQSISEIHYCPLYLAGQSYSRIGRVGILHPIGAITKNGLPDLSSSLNNKAYCRPSSVPISIHPKITPDTFPVMKK